MTMMTAGVTKADEGIEGKVWSILGQTYVPKQLCDSSFSWFATFPPGTFVPPHYHISQDEFIYVLEGTFDLYLDGKDAKANTAELIRLPMGIPHGIFNKSDKPVHCLFWVSPARRLWDLFNLIHNVPDPNEVVRLAAQHEVYFLPPPPGQG
jgi:uncharacterized RmlC-like cupin family protein